MGPDDQKSVTSGAESLVAAARAAARRGPAPVHLWNPPDCGEIDMRIARDGTWFYLGTPIGRKPLVKLFASILRRDEERFVLVTPVEKVGIRVDDAPFAAVDFDISGQGRDQVLTFVTNVDDTAEAGEAHPIRVERNGPQGEPAPYLLIRSRLEALIDRKTFYRLTDLCVHERHEGTDWFGLWSGGVFFPFIPSDQLLA